MSKWKDLTICDDFIFKKVMLDVDICKELLEMILDTSIARVEYIEVEKTIDISVDSKSVRLDVYMKDGNNAYNIEMQTVNENDLPKRSRYYQGMIDMDLIGKGVRYDSLDPSYIIFICAFDPFKKDSYMYTFQNTCKEVENLTLGDETKKIFLNAKSANKATPKLRAFLNYVAGKESDDAFVRRIDEAVKKVKDNEKWRMEYMTLLVRDQKNIEKGIGLGRNQRDTEIVINMNRKGVSKSLIAELAGLSEEKVDEILSGALASK